MTTPIDWAHVYLLGWYDKEDRLYLTSWDGGDPIYHFVVTGGEAPLWDAFVPDGVGITIVPEGADPKGYARDLRGLHAFGWVLSGGVERRPKR